MHVFITGIAGFIGFHLARFLRSRGNGVVGCDNFNAYYTPSLKRERAALLEQEGVRILEHSIEDGKALKECLECYGITHVVHLAAQAGVRYSKLHPDECVQANIHGFLHILDLIRSLPHIRLIYASSSSVYGLNTKIPFSENDPTDQPANLYGATKKSNELMAFSYHHMFGISVTGLRFFTAYGPWGRPDMAYFTFADAIVEGRPIHIYNQGNMARDFTYIDDIVLGIVAALDRCFHCDLFNLGGHRPESVLTLVALLEQKLGRQAILEMMPFQAGEVQITCADTARSRACLDFMPRVTLDEGLDRFVTWYKVWKQM